LIVRFRKQLFIALLLPGLFFATNSVVPGQSSDQSLPTAVSANEINGRIAALDLGDARLTRYFYAFEGTPGDLLITVDSKNLNGDMDIFTAVTFRPLMKTTLYASSQAGEVTKGLYLRTHQILILRVEARTPNDEDGSYHVRFGGTFQPFSGGIPVAENSDLTSETAPGRGNKRLSSVGATIAEPVVEKAPANTESKTVAATEKPSEDPDAAKKTSARKKRPARPTSTARNSRGRTLPVRPKPAPPNTETPKTSEAKTEETKPAEEKSREPKPEAGKVDTGAATEEETAKSKAQDLPAPGAHLIIESKDGTRIDRPMSTVRRVVVEGGVIVIVLKTGRIERVPMSTVNRMAIEP
jgi:hypothetical protein